MTSARADLWHSRYWNTDGGRAVYWIERALRAGATYTAKQAARCFWILACDALGEVAARREVEIAGLAFPDEMLGGVYAEYQRQRAQLEPRRKSARQTAKRNSGATSAQKAKAA
jgi:hypothetical protein